MMNTRLVSRRLAAAALAVLLLWMALPAAAVLAASDGPGYPGTVVSSGAGTPWTASTTALVFVLGADDDEVAQVESLNGSSQVLDLTDFGFSVPADATITGIRVEINRFASQDLAIKDVTVRLLRDGTPAGNNKAFPSTWGTNTGTVATYGSFNDLWGTTWTPADVNAAGFGVTLVVTNTAVGSVTPAVDFVRILVFYTLASSLSVTNSPVTYDGQPQTAAVSGSVPGAVSDIKYNGLSTAPTNAGTYAVTADFVPADPDYTALDDAPAGNFVIEKAAQETLTVNDPSPLVFGSTAELSAAGGSGSGALTFSSGASTGCSVLGSTLSVTNASGTCVVTATRAEDDNYLAATSAPLTVTLQKAETVTTVTGGAFPYDGNAHTATVSVSGPGGLSLTPGPTYSGSCSAAPVTVAEGASCTASYTYPGDSNYLGSSDSDSITIERADALISITPYHVTYDGTAHTASGAATGVNGEDLSAGLSLAGTAHTEAGSYPDDPWTFTSPDPNYNDDSGTVSNSIARANALFIIDSYDVIYDGTAHTASGAATGVNGEDLSAGLSFSGTAHTEAGIYTDDPWTFTSPGPNYHNDSGTINNRIRPRSLTISGLTANDKPYDGTTAATLSGTPELVGVIAGDTVALGGTPVASFADPNVGENKPVTVTGFTLGGADAGNYTLVQPTGLTASITPASLTVSGITAEDRVYDGTTAATLNLAGAVLEGVAAGDLVSLDTSAAVGDFADKNVGAGKTVTVSGLALTGADAAKYQLTQPTTTADITPRDLNVTAAGADRVYDGTTAATVTLSSDALAGDTVTLAYTSASFADPNVGTNKPIAVSGISIGGADAGNYSLLSTTATAAADITKAPLTVKADNKTKAVGQPDPPFTFSYIGLVNGETGAVIDTPPTCGVPVPHEGVGTYTIECSGGADDNYTFTYINGMLTVTLTPIQSFDDVPPDYWAYSFIERLYGSGITSGCGVNPLRYCPEGTVTRAQMAVFLLRGIHGSSYTPPAVGASTGFGDVPTNYWAAAFIKQLAAEGITVGCGGGNYCPEGTVTRAQMAVFLLRAKHGASYTPPAVGASTGFGDVQPTYWAAAFIKQLVAEGITVGCGGGNYCPEAPVTRAQMAVFLVRTFSLP